MGKFTTYLLIMTGLTLLFHFLGLIPIGSTPNSQLMLIMLNIENISFSSFFTEYVLFSLTAVIAAGGAIIIGIVTKDYALVAMYLLADYLATVMWDFLKVYSVLAAENFIIATLIFAPIMFLFAITIVDWWRGRD